jgi:hypothetical protein
VPVTTVISVTFVVLGPAVLAAVMLMALLQRRRQRAGQAGNTGTARIIVSAAAIAAVLVTIGILISWRQM